MTDLDPVTLLVKTCVLLVCLYEETVFYWFRQLSYGSGGGPAQHRSGEGVSAIKCYQCSTSDDPKGEDLCGAYEYYDKTKNTAVECLGEEAHALGTFCYKKIQQSPRGFIWDGRWRSVERRCAQISERGVNWGCDWGYHENGVYWEECYCAEDNCNGAPKAGLVHLVLVFCATVGVLRHLLVV